jgi:uncharacterized membrane protein (UPF0136 family)
MTYTISQPESLKGNRLAWERKSAIGKFFEWAANEDKEHHVAWVGVSITAMAAVFFPLTMAVILVNGAAFGLIITAMISLALVVITNLAAMPTRYTIPFFILGILIDIVAIIVSFTL